MRRPGLFIVSALITAWPAVSQDARDIVRKSSELLHGLSARSELSMTIIKPEWSRSITMKTWAIEPDYALVYVLEPASDKGTVTLKRKTEVWNWLPSIQRVIKIPPSMMLQSWMGSDFTNDDLVRQSSIVEDYSHQIIGRGLVAGRECYEIQLTPKPDAGVVWGKVILWISIEGFLQLKAEYYDEANTLEKVFTGSHVREMGGRTIPTVWEMTTVAKQGNKTVMEYKSMQFDVKLDPGFFSEQNMKHIH